MTNDFLDNLGANLYRRMHKTTKKNKITNQITNPLSPVKNTRETYSKWLDRNITEVEVQFGDEEPAWIPYETLLAIFKRFDVNENSFR
tara:strand:- start:3230 stop:3493 length:264 start_codon:yes stop_codon:yes gene_type:complete